MKRALTLPQCLMTLAGLFLLCFALTGCAKILDPGPPISRVLLSPELPKSSAASGVLPQQVLVARPTVADDLNTDRIAALFNGLEIKYLSKARWTASVPAMVQRLMIESLESTNRLAGVGDEGSGLSSQLRLSTDIKRFYLRYDNASQPVAEVMVTLRLVDMKTGASLGFTSLQARENAKSEDIKDLTFAFDAAASRVLAQSSAWVLEKAQPMK